MASISILNPKAEFARAQHAFNINISAARGLHDVLKTNLGPKGTMKMLVSGAGDIKITKDGNVLLHEMQIQHPTASLIARVATAQDDMTGDGTTSIVLLISELLKQAEIHTSEGLHPRLVTEGFELARNKCLELLSQCTIETSSDMPDRSLLLSVVGTALRTKVHHELAEKLTEGEDKFTYVEECKNPHSVTLLMKGPNKHTLTQIKDAVNDGLKAAKNTLEDACVVPGAGAFEIVAHRQLTTYANEIKGRARLGVHAFANALLIIPKVLAGNAGHDVQDTMVKLLEEADKVEKRCKGNPPKEIVGLDLTTGDAMVPFQVGIYDNYIVKKQIISSCAVIASNVLLVDEIMRAGLSSLKG